MEVGFRIFAEEAPPGPAEESHALESALHELIEQLFEERPLESHVSEEERSFSADEGSGSEEGGQDSPTDGWKGAKIEEKTGANLEGKIALKALKNLAVIEQSPRKR